METGDKQTSFSNSANI